MLASVLLLASALFAAFALRARRADAATRDHARMLAAARLVQYLTLLLAAAVLLPGTASGVMGRLLTAVGLFFAYALLVALLVVAAARFPGPFTVPLAKLLRPLAQKSGTLLDLFATSPERVEDRTGGGEEEREEALEEWLAASGLRGEELALLGNSARFGEKTAGELMVPRPDVHWLSLGDDPREIVDEVRRGHHSRYPLCQESLDQVVGYLHVRDLLQSRAPLTKERLRALSRPVSFVPETASALTLLRRFQKERSHLAVVVDEFGGTAGILTLEDLLEALVGEIRDEFDDEEEAEVKVLADGEVLVDGAVRLEDLERAYGFSFGDVEEETIGGFVFGRLAREVSAGDELELPGARVRVEGVEGLRVTRVRVIPVSTPEGLTV